MRKLERFVVYAAFFLGLWSATLWAMEVLGYLDLQVIAMAPANPASGFMRVFATGSTVGCLTSSGANCLPGFANPMTTLGDLIVGGSSGTPQRLGVGTNGQALTANSGATNGVDWEAPLTLTTTGTSGAATLTAGNPYTLNVPQYSAGGSGAMTQICLTTLASPAATITCSSIPGTSTSLLVIFTLKSTSATNDNAWMQANADGAANYFVQQVYGAAATAGAGTAGVSAKPAFLGSDLSGANYPAVGQITIPNYAKTTFRKMAVTEWASQFASGAISSASSFINFAGWYWNNTAAITQLQFGTTSGSNLDTGSQVAVYGIN